MRGKSKPTQPEDAVQQAGKSGASGTAAGDGKQAAAQRQAAEPQSAAASGTAAEPETAAASGTGASGTGASGTGASGTGGDAGGDAGAAKADEPGAGGGAAGATGSGGTGGTAGERAARTQPPGGRDIGSEVIDAEVLDTDVVGGEVIDAEVVDAGPAAPAGAAPAGTAGGDGTTAPPENSLGAEIGALRSDLDEMTRDLQRVSAEYANYRRRVERDRSMITEQAIGTVLTALLPVLDDLDRARDHGDLVGPFGSVAEQLTATVGKFGLTSFGEKGDPFDPTRHEAVAHQTSEDVTEATCVDVMRRGYMLGDRLLRPAMVAVADPQ